MLPPDVDQTKKRDREGEEAPHHLDQLRVALRRLERDDQQRDGEAEDHVAEGLEARHFVRAMAKLDPVGHLQAILPLNDASMGLGEKSKSGRTQRP